MARLAASLVLGSILACQHPPEPAQPPPNSEAIAPAASSAPAAQASDGAPTDAWPQPRKTVHLDHEVRVHQLRDRSAAIAAALGATRGLASEGTFEVELVDRDSMREFVQRAMLKDTPRDHLQRLGRIQASLGVLPPGIDAEVALLDLYQAGLLGVYDPDAKTLRIGDYVPQDMIEAVLGHEIAHALQDMHFDLAAMQGTTREPSGGRNDADLARTFLIEGDAHATYLAWESDRHPDQFSDRQLDMYADQALEVAASLPYPVLGRQLQMPYTEATNVVLRFVRHRGWSRVDKLYERLPVSTEQMLHADKLLADERPRRVRARAERLAAVWPDHSPVWKDDLGEACLLAMLAEVTGTGQARLGARGWDGDRYVALERADGAASEVPIVAGLIAWDTATDAEEFEPMFRDYLAARVPGHFRVQRKRDLVAFVTGEEVPEDRADRVPRGVWNTFIVAERKKGWPR